MRATGTYVTTTALGEAVSAFVPHPLPPADPPLAPGGFRVGDHRAKLALARLVGVAGPVPSVDWLLYSALRKVALLTSQTEGIQATLTDRVMDEALRVGQQPRHLARWRRHEGGPAGTRAADPALRAQQFARLLAGAAYAIVRKRTSWRSLRRPEPRHRIIGRERELAMPLACEVPHAVLPQTNH
jgi:hypothetical protein